MEAFERVNLAANLLEKAAEKIDISESRFMEAQKRYEAMRDWLNAEDSNLRKYLPEVFLQGSFCLGTVIKPISNQDEYDIDVVCNLAALQQKDTSQSALKKVVGDRIKQNVKYSQMLDSEGRRCWTVVYANEFHIDVLPAIPDAVLRAGGGYFADALFITDKKQMERNPAEWPRSNPQGYAKWFFSRQEVIALAIRKRLAVSLKVSDDKVPFFRVKTPLQRSIQILKRHRDIYFSRADRNADFKPISIIITTLAAQLYKGQDNVHGAIYDILNAINQNMLTFNGKFCILNPVNPNENFADKWNEDSRLSAAFFEWLKQAKNDFGTGLLLKDSDMELGASIGDVLGVTLDQKEAESKSNVAPAYIKVNTSNERRPWSA